MRVRACGCVSLVVEGGLIDFSLGDRCNGERGGEGGGGGRREARDLGSNSRARFASSCEKERERQREWMCMRVCD